MQLIIDQLWEDTTSFKDRTTGEQKTLPVWKFSGKDGTLYTAFKGKWNGDWRPGLLVEVGAITPTKSQVNGKQVYKISAPEHAKYKPDSASGGGIDQGIVTTILNELSEIKSLLKSLSNQGPTTAPLKDLPDFSAKSDMPF